MLVILLLGVQAGSLIGLTLTVQASTVTFGNTINLSNDSVPSGLPVMATSGKYVYVAWLNDSCADCKSDVLFRASSDNGTTFGAALKLSTTPNGDAENQQIAAAGNNVYIVWDNNVSATEKDVFFRASINNGGSFGSTVNLCSSSSCGGITSITSSYVPNVAAAGNNVTVVWFSDSTKNTTPNPILYKTSTAKGSDMGTVTATSLSGKAYSQTPALAPPKIAEVGKFVYVTWSDVRNTPNSQAFFAASSNGGSSFGTSISLNGGTTASTETDSYLAIAAAGNNVYVGWTNDTTSTDNTMFRASTNNGVSFGSLTSLYKGQFTDLNPQIAATGQNVYVVWSNATVSGPQILYRISSNNGGSFNPVAVLTSSPAAPPQQAVQAFGGNVYVAWAGNSPMDSSMFASNDTTTTFAPPQDLSPTTGSTILPTPVIAVSGSNVYVAWQDDTQGNGDIFFRASVHATTTSVSCSPTVVAINQGTSCTVTVADTSVNPTTPTGTVSFTSSVSTSSFTPSTTCTLTGSGSSVTCSVTYTQTASITTPTITASYSGDAIHASTSGTTTVAVSLRSTLTAVSCSPSTVPVSTSTTCTASVTDSSLGTANTPTGSASFTSSGAGSFSATNCSLVSGGCSVTFTPSATGSDTITGSYGGDSVHATSSGTFSLTVNPSSGDVAVTNMFLSRTFGYNGVTSGNPIIINVTASNPGSVIETFTVRLWGNRTQTSQIQIGSGTSVTLSPGASQNVTFTWNPSVPLPSRAGYYALSANASQVSGETNLSNNLYSWSGIFRVRLKGDVNDDCRVDIVDLAKVGTTFGKSADQAGYNTAADLNNDGVINIVDLVLVASVFGQTC